MPSPDKPETRPVVVAAGGPAAAGEPPKKRRRPIRSCLLIFLFLICGLGVAAGGAYWAFQSGQISALQLQAQVSGIATVTVYNLADERVTIELTQLDAAEPFERERQQLEPFDSGSYGGLPPGRYRLDFTGGGSPTPRSCTLRTERSDEYLFVVVPEGITVVNERARQASAADLMVSTSPLCQA